MKKSKEKKFFWRDKSGRGFTATFSLSQVIKAFVGERGDDGIAASTWAKQAEVGDEWTNAANNIIRTE